MYIEKAYLLTGNGGSEWVETFRKKLVVRVSVKETLALLVLLEQFIRMYAWRDGARL